MPAAKVPPLPEVAAPSLDRFEVEVEAPPPIDEATFTEALGEVLHDLGEVIERGPADPIQPDDEVLVDLLAYADGRVVPFSAKAEVWLSPADEAILPGVRPRLDGKTIGEKVKLEVHFPPDYAFEPLAKQRLDYEVDIKAARRVVIPDLEDPRLLKAFEVETPEQMFEAVYADLEAEREAELQSRINFAVFHELQRRLGNLDIPAEILDAELAQRWEHLEGDLLQSHGVPADERRRAQRAYVDNEGVRAELIHGLRIAMALAAIAKSHGLRPAKEDFMGMVRAFAEGNGLSTDAVLAKLRTDTKDHGALGEALLLQSAAQLVLDRARVTIV